MGFRIFLYNLSIKLRDKKIIYYLGHPILKRIRERGKKKQIKNFHKYGEELLSKLSSACKEHNVVFWLDFGTLLGAIREHDFIKHDFDIDVAVHFEDRKAFQSAITDFGFTLAREFRIMDENKLIGLEQTFSYKKVLIDIFYYRRNTDDSFILNTFVPILDDPNLAGKAEIKETIVPYYGLKPYIFKGIPVNIPKDEISYLKFHYGENYMTPDPNYNSANIVKTIKYIDRKEKVAEFHQFKREYL